CAVDARRGQRIVERRGLHSAGTPHVRLRGRRLGVHPRSTRPEGEGSRARRRGLGRHRRKAVSRRWLVGVALLVAAQGAHAQDPLAIPGVDAGTIAQLRQIVAATAERGLPVDPIVGEARFAALRRVAAPTLIDAAKRVAERLEIARTALKPEPTPADIAAGAEALKYGVPPDALTAI